MISFIPSPTLQGKCGLAGRSEYRVPHIVFRFLVSLLIEGRATARCASHCFPIEKAVTQDCTQFNFSDVKQMWCIFVCIVYISNL